MKRPLNLLLYFFVLTWFLYGCRPPTQPSIDDNPPPTEGQISQSETVVQNTDYGEIGSVLYSNEMQYILNSDASANNIIEIFGEPNSKTEATIWAADGLEHQSWFYDDKGVKFDMVRDDKNIQLASSIDIKSPCVLKTSKGIGIGSSKDDVVKAYGNEIDPESLRSGTESIVAGTVYGGLIFSFEGNTVSQIFIGAAAE